MLLFTVFQRGDKYTAGSDQLPAVQSSRRVVEHDDILADALLFLLNSGFLTEILFCHTKLLGCVFD